MGLISTGKQAGILFKGNLGFYGTFFLCADRTGVKTEDHAVVADDPGREVIPGREGFGDGLLAVACGIAGAEKTKVFVYGGDQRFFVIKILYDVIEGNCFAGSGVESDPSKSCGAACGAREKTVAGSEKTDRPVILSDRDDPALKGGRRPDFVSGPVLSGVLSGFIGELLEIFPAGSGDLCIELQKSAAQGRVLIRGIFGQEGCLEIAVSYALIVV